MTVRHSPTYAELAQSYAQELRRDLEAKGIKQTLEYIKEYGDAFVLEDEDVTQSVAHLAAINYLLPFLEWLFQGQNVGVAVDLLFYLPGNEESKVGPDIAIVNGLVTDTSNSQKSYGVGVDGPPPSVVFEFASDETWNKDLTIKLDKYEQMGVREYFVYDPNPEMVWKGEWQHYQRLAGWRLNEAGVCIPLSKDEQERLRSQELQSWLRVDTEQKHNLTRHWLNLYDLDGNLRLTEAQVSQRMQEVERQRAKQEKERADHEKSRADQAENALAAERQRIQELEALLKKLKPQQ